jgi:ATP phosphoribosyltransferase
VESGLFDLALTGKDWILENGSDVVELADLVYSKATYTPAKWVLAVDAGSPVRTLEDLRGGKIATELVNFTRRLSPRGASKWRWSSPGAPPRPRWWRTWPTPSSSDGDRLQP